MNGPDTPDPAFRSGYVALVGAPNVGKSTLLNRLLGRRLSIATPRPQTTRRRLLGILNGPGHQAVLVDTPGLLEPKYKLQELMRQEVGRALHDADVVLALFEAGRPVEPELLRRVGTGRRLLVAINKIDLVPSERLLAMVAEITGGLRPGAAGATPVFLISALKGKGVEDLKAAVVAALPEGAPLYPPDQVAEQPERFFVAEFVREALFFHYRDEIPYSTTVLVEEFCERPGRKDYVRAVVYVERVSQRRIVIGRGGQALKRAGSAKSSPGARWPRPGSPRPPARCSCSSRPSSSASSTANPS
ncbi:MAG TPA: GTPase Era, partial [candidate division WOR-3 bacterium]|nr:GTPase Era [candidate division WOR-3 bacterium]